jgi:MFS family permease
MRIMPRASALAGKLHPSSVPTAVADVGAGERGLDWFTFFCANLQTGFGPFVSVYLTTQKWSQTDIGFVLMIGGLIGLVGQMPGGAFVDRARAKILLAGASLVVIGVAALMVALNSNFAIILLAWVLHALASCVLSPSIAIISLGLVGHARISRRLGRNASFASIGSALAAAAMGGCGYYFSNKAVFFVTAALAVPALVALWTIRGAPARAGSPHVPVAPKAPATDLVGDVRVLLGNRALVVLSASVALFYLGNAAMLPLVGSMLTLRSAHSPTIFIAACIIAPQIMVAVLSPLAGATAQTWGRRPLLLIAFAALPLRGLGLALVGNPFMLVAVQLLDGVSASVLGVVIPLIAADATRGSDRYALAQGMIGTTMGLGAAFSTTIAGVITDRFGSSSAFLALTGIAVVALLLPLVAMPETKPMSDAEG